MLDVDDLLQTDGKGRGMINVLSAEELIRSPKLCRPSSGCCRVFERLPESATPKTDAGLLLHEEAPSCSTTPRRLVEKVEQVVHLIRSKGVGVFVTQSRQYS